MSAKSNRPQPGFHLAWTALAQRLSQQAQSMPFPLRRLQHHSLLQRRSRPPE
jgi:hypothetical protein